MLIRSYDLDFKLGTAVVDLDRFRAARLVGRCRLCPACHR